MADWRKITKASAAVAPALVGPAVMFQISTDWLVQRLHCHAVVAMVQMTIHFVAAGSMFHTSASGG